jgi:hypothetical protein
MYLHDHARTTLERSDGEVDYEIVFGPFFRLKEDHRDLESMATNPDPPAQLLDTSVDSAETIVRHPPIVPDEFNWR